MLDETYFTGMGKITFCLITVHFLMAAKVRLADSRVVAEGECVVQAVSVVT